MHDGDCTRKRSLSGWSQLILDLIELCPDPLTISNYFYLPMRSRDCKGGSSSKVVEGMFGTERVNSSDRSEKEQPNRVLAQPIIPAVSREKKRKKKRHKQYLRQNQWNTGNSERRTEFQCQMLREDKKILQMRMKVWNERLNFTLQLSRNTRLCWSWNEAMQKKKTKGCFSEDLTVLELFFAAGQNAAGQHACRGQSLQRQHALTLLSEADRNIYMVSCTFPGLFQKDVISSMLI